MWSDPSIWNNGTSIATTDNITIQPCWHMTLDQSAELDNLTIMGIFSVPSSGSVTLKVQFMWIMPGGSFLVGASDDPYRLLTSG